MILNKRRRFAFDIGNVLCYVDFSEFYRELAIQGVCDNIELAEQFLIDVQNALDLGIYNISQALRLYFPKINKTQVSNLSEAWLTVVKPCDETINILQELIEDKQIQVAILSNIGFDHADYLSNKLNKIFKNTINHFSCDVGARKPTKIYYQSFIKDNPYFSEVYNVSKFLSYRGLFIDDREENVHAAKPYLDSKVFNLYHYKSGTEAAEAFKKIIVDI